MTWLKELDHLSPADLPQVGYKAYWLGLLRQQHLPTAPGQVLPAQAWQTAVQSIPDLDSSPLASFESPGQTPQALQQISHAAQRAIAMAPLPATLGAELEQWPYPNWILRPSLGPDSSSAHSPPTDLWGLLPAQAGGHCTGTVTQSLREFWRQALTAPSLVVWQRARQPLHALRLATLIMPLYPALASGTLTLTPAGVTLEAVLGLGLCLSRGEAIPARCHWSLAQADAPAWEPGFQEHCYQLSADCKGLSPDPSDHRLIQPIQRETPDLVEPITPEQLKQLLQIAHQAQRILTQHRADYLSPNHPIQGIRLEWLISPGPGSRWDLVITQATPLLPTNPNPGTEGVPQTNARPSLSPPPLPAVTTVVQGIGAAAGQAQGVAVVARNPQHLPRPLPPSAIVVLPDLQPDVFLQLEAVAGIVTEQGGATCHAAILAREIGIPAIVGAPQATELLDNNTQLWLDGDRGIVYAVAQGALPSHPLPTVSRKAVGLPDQPAPRFTPEQTARYGQLRTKVMANLSQIRRLSALPFDQLAGIGLLRSEWLLLDILEGRHPWHWVNQGQAATLQTRLTEQLEPLLQALGPKPLRYRSLDLRSHEWQALVGSPPLEPNPMLGLRGTLSYDVDARLFEVELAALATLQRAGYTNLQLILPFVRTVEEVLACQPLIQQAGLTDYKDFALWIMAEVPSVLFLLPAYAQAGVQGITIGSNDLTQLLLAVDRDQPIMASAYDERHPVVQMAMAHLIQEAARCGLTCSICGQAPVRHPNLIADLVAWGINSISVEVAALPYTLEAVWQAEQTMGH
ncbi:MAG TPA: hypothetical protein IGR64_02265 [Leptolyngbyaceae cyanobacterium M65_K2018_010]|nr:hypothetical protein [Leptolyngbyaceae cyanobacterium M65_K2018_010]